MIKHTFYLRLVAFIFLLPWYSFAFTQNKLEVEESCVDIMYGDYHQEIPKIRVSAFNQFPTKIQYIVTSWLNISMTDFKNDLRFVSGQILNFDTILSKDSVIQINTPYQLPKYELYFEMTAPSLHIKKYCLGIELDNYGQIIYFGWPKEGYNKKETFIDLAEICEMALKLAEDKEYKTETRRIQLIHSRPMDRLNWHISFLQKTTGDEINYEKEYKTFVIDAVSLNLIDEYDMIEANQSMPEFLPAK